MILYLRARWIKIVVGDRERERILVGWNIHFNFEKSDRRITYSGFVKFNRYGSDRWTVYLCGVVRTDTLSPEFKKRAMGPILQLSRNLLPHRAI
jgi:hypothetical protein